MMVLRLRKPGVSRRVWVMTALALAMGAAGAIAQYQYRVVPGRGQKVTQVGDDFEEEDWDYIANVPKSSTNIDHQDRLPAGISKNQRVYESTYRGQPDIVKRIETPRGGLRGSKWSLAMRSIQTGIPGRPSFKMN